MLGLFHRSRLVVQVRSRLEPLALRRAERLTQVFHSLNQALHLSRERLNLKCRSQKFPPEWMREDSELQNGTDGATTIESEQVDLLGD
jgi:hypothetical protein